MTSPETLHPLFAAIGGKGPLAAVVDRFYDLVLADPAVAPLFAATDMAAQRKHQVEFLAAALGGPDAWRGPSLRSAHAGRGITRDHFRRVAGHLDAALAWGGVRPEVRSVILTTVAALAPEVIDQPQAPKAS